MKTKKIIPLPFFVYFLAISVLVFIGLADSIYLAWSHYRNYTDIAYKSFCAVSKALNCDTVSQSPYAIFWGVPVAVWGGIGYGFFVLFLPLAITKSAEKRRTWTLLFIVSSVFSLISIVLAFISSFYIHSYCIMCILSFAVNFLLAYYTWLVRKRFGVFSFFYELKQDVSYLWMLKKQAACLFVPFLIGVALIITFYPKYWEFKIPVTYADIPVGVTEDGHPWIGSEDPALTITEFTDYLCFQCRKMNFYLRQIIMENPGKIRLIHRHYPMDNRYNFAVKTPFHVGAGDLALVAIYASTKGKFWKANDLLFNLSSNKGKIKIKELADKLGLNFKELKAAIRDKKNLDHLGIDLWDGYKLGITGTPAYVINGKVYKGRIPPEIIRRVLEK